MADEKKPLLPPINITKEQIEALLKAVEALNLHELEIKKSPQRKCGCCCCCCEGPIKYG